MNTGIPAATVVQPYMQQPYMAMTVLPVGEPWNPDEPPPEYKKKDVEGNIIWKDPPRQEIIAPRVLIWDPLGPGKNCQVDNCKQQGYAICDQRTQFYSCIETWKGCNRRFCYKHANLRIGINENGDGQALKMKRCWDK